MTELVLKTTETKSELHIVTVATHADGYFFVLLQSAALLDVRLKVLGWGCAWQGLDWKLRLLLDYCKALPPDDVVMFIDGFDTVLLQPSEVILERFLAFKVPFLITAESCRHLGWTDWFFECYHDCMFKDRHVDAVWPAEPSWANKELDMRRLNSGGWIGICSHVVSLLTNVPASETNDQHYLTARYFEGTHGIHLDHNCSIFHLWRTRGCVKVLPTAEAVEKYPFLSPAQLQALTEAKQGATSKDCSDRRGADGGPKSVVLPQLPKAQPRHTTVAGTAVDIETESAPCLLHVHCRRSIDPLVRQLGLTSSQRIVSMASVIWYVYYSITGSLQSKPFVLMILSVFTFCTGGVLTLITALLMTVFWEGWALPVGGGPPTWLRQACLRTRSRAETTLSEELGSWLVCAFGTATYRLFQILRPFWCLWLTIGLVGLTGMALCRLYFGNKRFYGLAQVVTVILCTRLKWTCLASDTKLKTND